MPVPGLRDNSATPYWGRGLPFHGSRLMSIMAAFLALRAEKRGKGVM
jgi:hypothetical protein